MRPYFVIITGFSSIIAVHTVVKCKVWALGFYGVSNTNTNVVSTHFTFSESSSRHLIQAQHWLVIWYSGNGVRHVSSRRIAFVMRGEERWNWSISKFRGDNSSCFGQTDVKLYFGRSRQQTTLCQDQILFWSEGCTEQTHWRFVFFAISALFIIKTWASLRVSILG